MIIYMDRTIDYVNQRKLQYLIPKQVNAIGEVNGEKYYIVIDG